MEETTTAAPENTGVEASTQPAAPDAQAAEQPQTEQPTQSAPSEDDTAEWLVKKGLDPKDPEFAMKIAKSYREAEKLALKSAEKASQLEKSLSQPQSSLEEGVDPNMAAITSYIQRQEQKERLNDFKQAHPDWQQYDTTMGELLTEPLQTMYGEVTRKDLIDSGLLSLEDVYAMAKGATPVDTTEIQAKTRTEVLQTLANTQRAGGATAQASVSNPKTPDADPIMEALRKSRGE